MVMAWDHDENNDFLKVSYFQANPLDQHMAATNVFGQQQHLFGVDFDPPIRPIPLQYWSDSIGNIGSIHLEVYWVFHIGMGWD